MGSRIRVEIIELSEPRGLNSFLKFHFVPEADIANINPEAYPRIIGEKFDWFRAVSF